MAVRVWIEGRVQGVGFRYWVARLAETLGVSGWVRNRRDGSVEALFAGDLDTVRKMISRCHEGPPVSHVTKLTEQEVETPAGTGFEVRPTAP